MSVRRHSFAVAVAVTCIYVAADLRAQPATPTTTINGVPACANCEIVLEKVFTVTDIGDSASIQVERAPIRDSRGRFFFQSANGMNGIVVFDSTGKLLTRFGRSGNGPGEFGGLGFSMTIGRGDTLFVCGARQCQLFSPALRYVRAIPTVPGSITHGAVTLANGDLALRMYSSDSVLSRNPVHRMSTTGALVRSFGAETPFDRGCTRCVTSSGLGLARNREDVWVAPAGRYELQLWSGDGQFKRRIMVRNSPWYTAWTPGGATTTPMSRISRIVEADSGVVFVFGYEAEKLNQPRPLPPPGVKLTANEAALLTINVKWTPHIEALDLARGVVLASKSVPGTVISTFGGEHLATLRDGMGSTQYVDVWRVRVARR